MDERSPGAELQRSMGNQAVQRLLNENSRAGHNPSRPSGFPARRATFEGDFWERDASRRAEAAMARQSDVAMQMLQSKAMAPSAGGKPLHPIVRSAMETTFGHDFSGIRLFEGNAAAQLNARAVNFDRDIFFAPGEYQLDLLAHELAHVVQRDLGGPALAYRQGRGDMARMETALRHAAATLGSSVRFLPTPELQSLVRSMVSLISAFFPSGHGLINEHGAVTRSSQAVFLDQSVRRGSITGTYRHQLRIFLSEERPTEDARYQPNANGGEVRIFVHNTVSLSESELIATLAHELVHLFTDVMFRAEQFAHRLPAAQPPLPRPAESGTHPVSISIQLADPTLGHNSAIGGQIDALRRVYQPVVDFLNVQRIARGEQPLDAVAVSAGWTTRTTDELLAYIIDQQVNIGVQLATDRGRARVAFTIPLDPLSFFRVYAGRHWLDNPRDRAALQLPDAEPILRAAGNSAEMRAVYQTIEQWVTATAATPSR
jgi:hypothetical protein